MNDLISRQTAIDVIKKDRDASDMPKMWYQGVDYAINHLIHLPSAQPEPKEPKEPCSACESLEDGDTLYAHSDWDGGIAFDYICDIKYCPVCGRRLNNG